MAEACDTRLYGRFRVEGCQIEFTRVWHQLSELILLQQAMHRQVPATTTASRTNGTLSGDVRFVSITNCFVRKLRMVLDTKYLRVKPNIHNLGLQPTEVCLPRVGCALRVGVLHAAQRLTDCRRFSSAGFRASPQEDYAQRTGRDAKQ